MSLTPPPEKKKRKGANGAPVPIKVESSSITSSTSCQPEHDDDTSSSEEEEAVVAVAVAPPDDSSLSPIERALRVGLQMEDSVAVERALAELTYLCSSSQNNNSQNAGQISNRAAVVRAGGPALIAAALRKWYACPAIQALGCQAVQNASYKNNAFKQCARDAGVLDAIAWAMQSYPNDLAVQENGIGAISNFISFKSNADYIVQQLQFVNLLLSAMNAFKHEVVLQKNACYTLRNLLYLYVHCWRDDSITAAVLQAPGDARQALLDAIKNHADTSRAEVVEILEKASGALRILLPC